MHPENIISFYSNIKLSVDNHRIDKEGKEYNASTFSIQNKKIIYRKAKITSTKKGLFVTFWKRSELGPIAPFHEQNDFDFFIVDIETHNLNGQFIFPKSILVEKGIVSNDIKEGKRAFRVYPPFVTDLNKQAQKTQQWQAAYFIEINGKTDSIEIKKCLGLID